MLSSQPCFESLRDRTAGPLAILNDASLSLDQGDAIAIVGPSGSGKSTLLYVLGALEPPDRGTVTLEGVNPFTLSENDLSAFRNKQCGICFPGPLPAPAVNRA